MSESTVAAGTTFADWTAGRKGGVAITGASGWIGSAVVDFLLRASPSETPIPLRLFGSRPRKLEITGRRLPVESLCDAAPLGAGDWLIVHLAVLGGEPDGLKAANDALLDQAFGLAQTGSVRRFVYASSGAVYQTEGSVRKRAYAEMKRAQEDDVRAWAGRTGAPILIPRIFNVGGPYINHIQAYALGDFIQQALAGGAIRIEARQAVVRSYVHLFEFARVMLDLALNGEDALAFDTAGSEIVEMADLAQAVGRAMGLDLDIHRPPMEPGEDRYVGDGAVYEAALARSGAAPIGLDRIIRDTAAYLKGLRPAG
jgi:nucleoside-diphosphate-sugar epimerase